MGKKLVGKECFKSKSGYRSAEEVLLSSNQIRSLLFSKTKSIHHEIQKFSKNIFSHEFVSIVSNSLLKCPICLDLLVFACMMPCGHTFCQKCLDISLCFNYGCSLCRQDHSLEFSPIRSKIADNLVKLFLQSRSSDKLQYLCRMEEARQWMRRRRSIDVRIGQRIDVKDEFNVWRKGLVLRIPNYKQSRIIQVRIKIKGQYFGQKLEMSSNRLAPYRFFTRGGYLQDVAVAVGSKREGDKYEINIFDENNNFVNKSLRIQDEGDIWSEVDPRDCESYVQQSLIITGLDRVQTGQGGY